MSNLKYNINMSEAAQGIDALQRLFKTSAAGVDGKMLKFINSKLLKVDLKLKKEFSSAFPFNHERFNYAKHFPPRGLSKTKVEQLGPDTFRLSVYPSANFNSLHPIGYPGWYLYTVPVVVQVNSNLDILKLESVAFTSNGALRRSVASKAEAVFRRQKDLVGIWMASFQLIAQQAEFDLLADWNVVQDQRQIF